MYTTPGISTGLLKLMPVLLEGRNQMCSSTSALPVFLYVHFKRCREGNSCAPHPPNQSLLAHVHAHAAHLSVYSDKLLSRGGPWRQFDITNGLSLTTRSLVTEIELHNSCQEQTHGDFLLCVPMYLYVAAYLSHLIFI